MNWHGADRFQSTDNSMDYGTEQTSIDASAVLATTTQVAVSGSIYRRLVLLLVGSAAVLATILFLLVQQFVKGIAEESQDNILAASATSILDSVTSLGDELLVDIPYAALSMLGTVSDDRVFYQVTAAGQHVTGYKDLPAPSQFVTERLFVTLDYQQANVRLVQLSRQFIVAGKSVRVAVKVAQTRNVQISRQSTITNAVIYPGLVFFVLALALALMSARATVQPLRQLAASVSRRGPADLRPVGSPVPAEMVPLVGSLNRFMERLQMTLARSEEFIAEAAHRIRTPLATVRAQAEIALMRVEQAENRQSLKEMIRAIDESSRAAGQLLDHAMVSFRKDQLSQQSIALPELLLDTVERLRPVADLRDIELQLLLDAQGSIVGDVILIQSAVRNIVENAIKYSPREEVVKIQLREFDATHSQTRKGVNSYTLEICVSDNGLGFPAFGAASLTRRFARGDNVRDTVGSGLGLTIAEEVLNAHGGELQIHRGATGGACVCLLF